MTDQNDFQINEADTKKLNELQKKQEQLAQAKRLAIQKSVDKLKEELELSDMDCANMLNKSGVVKITCVKQSEPRMFVYNEKTQLWELKESMPKVNKAIHTILKEVADKKLAQLSILLNSKRENTPPKTNKNGFKESIFAGHHEMTKEMKDCKKAVKSLGSTNKLQNIFKSAGDCMCSESEFNKKMLTDNLIPIRTGCIDLATLEERPRTKEDMFNFYLDVAMTDKTEDAEKFLRPYCPENDEDTYKYLLDCLCYMITPWNFLKKFFILSGEEGNNGKSILMKVLKAMMGDLYTSVNKGLFTQMKGGGGDGATTNLNQCIGKFMGVYGESTSEHLDETIVKMITGDDYISFRRMYAETGSVKLYMKLVLVGNSKPWWNHNSPMANRVAYFPFERQFVDKPTEAHHIKKDDKLVTKMLTNKNYKDQLFSLLVRNAKSLYKRKKLHKSNYITDQFKLYMNEIDSTTRFMDSVVKVQKGKGMNIGQIFDQYKQWCNDNNYKTERKGDFSRKFKHKIPPRPTLLHGNTVYDVVMQSDQGVSVNVSPDTLDAYWRNESKKFLNEMEELTEERDLVTEERDETDKVLYEALDFIDAQKRRILELEQQMQKFYRQGVGEQDLQKSVFANLAKHAQGLTKHMRNRNRPKIPVERIV